MRERLGLWLILLLAILVAVVSASTYADSYNDGGRLAVVESLIDHGTLAIDDSIFVKVPFTIRPHPYRNAPEHLKFGGTLDRIKVGEHFYSHSPPTPMLIMAGWYKFLQWTTGLRAKTHADWFCYLMTLGSSGFAYVLAVWGIFRLGQIVGLSLFWRQILALSFALGSLALPYCQFVNSHILLLSVAVWLVFHLVQDRVKPHRGRWLMIGALAGFGYTIDSGIGQLLWGWTGLLILFRHRHWKPVLLVGLASLPFLLCHHIVNYQIVGSLKPAGSMFHYFDYPGSAFDESNLTGRWNHQSVGDFLVYAMELLFGHKGFFLYNLALWLAVPGFVILCRRRLIPRLEVGFILGWSISTWLLYAALSNNYSGYCLSIRWFLPLLAPGYYVVALVMKYCPKLLGDLLLLICWSFALGVMMAILGPWRDIDWIILFVQPATLITWAIYRWPLRQKSADSYNQLSEPDQTSTQNE